jgi:hypothetical protein
MAILTPADQTVREIVDRMVTTYHQPLRDADVTFRLLFASLKPDKNGDTKGNAVVLNGYPCLAKIQITPYDKRVSEPNRPGLPDCTITIDKEQWDMLTDRERDALVDHEIEHLELVEKTVKEVTSVDRDDADRPKLRCRRHDHQHGWFDAVVRRHGRAATECRQWEAFEEKRTQLWIPFMVDEPEDDDPEDDDAATLAMDRREVQKISRRMAGASR